MKKVDLFKMKYFWSVKGTVTAKKPSHRLRDNICKTYIDKILVSTYTKTFSNSAVRKQEAQLKLDKRLDQRPQQRRDTDVK